MPGKFELQTFTTVVPYLTNLVACNRAAEALHVMLPQSAVRLLAMQAAESFPEPRRYMGHFLSSGALPALCSMPGRLEREHQVHQHHHLRTTC